MSAVSLDDVLDAITDDDGSGFCIACGERQWGVEPDARGYECDSCGAHKVYGAEEILLVLA